MADSQQVHELFRKVQHPQIQDTVKALEGRADLDVITYLEADNHLKAAVSKIPEYQSSQNVSGIKASGGNSGVNSGGNSSGGGPRKGGRNRGSIYNYEGKVQTGYYHNWKVPRKENCKTVITAHKKNGSKSSHTARKKDVSKPSVSSTDYHQLLLK